MSEHQHQAAYFDWAKRSGIKTLDLLHATPNGGQRNILTAVKLKAEGVKAGEPDVKLPIARGGFIGLALEFKWNHGMPSKSQIDRIDAYQKAGWCVMLVWDWEAAKRATEGYLGCAEVTIK